MTEPRLRTEHEVRKFDEVALDYSRLHAQNVRASGEGIEYFARYKVACLRRLGVPREARILDYGCGIGNLTRYLEQAFGDVHGYDPSQESIEAARKAAPHGRYHASESELLLEAFDVAVVSGVLHHVPPDERRDLMHRVLDFLKPGGRVVVFEHNPLNPLTRRAVETCPFDDDAILLSPRELRVLLKHAGFSAVKQRYIVFFPHFLAWFRSLEPALGFCPLGAQTMTVGSRG